MARVDADVHGFLIVDKPAGVTSHDVVRRIRKALSTRQVGHAGTLDPMATGVLVVGVGTATRLLRFVEATTKTYEADVRFGARTTTLDATGEVVERLPAAHVTCDGLEAAFDTFRGEIEQVPPMVSAIRVDGERLHKKARRGEVVERKPRTVTIHALEANRFEPGEEPLASLRIECSPGTYIRTLADDLGVALGTRAHLATLRRSAVGAATITRAIALDDVSPDRLVPLADGLAHLASRELTADEADWTRHGRRIPAAGLSGHYLVTHRGSLVAVVRDDPDGLVRIEVGFPTPASVASRGEL